MVFLSLSGIYVNAQSLPHPSQWVFTELSGENYSPYSVSNINNNSCSVILPNNQLYFPPTQRMIRCQPDVNKRVSIRPRFTSDAEIMVHLNGLPNFSTPKYRFKTTVYKTENGVESLEQVSYKEFNTPGGGPGAILRQEHLNRHPAVTYYTGGDHEVRLVIEVQDNRPKNYFQTSWHTVTTLYTCKSEIRNRNGAPDFQILNSTFNNSGWPPHFQSCISNVQIQTQNTCNSNGFNLLVAEVDRNYNRTIVRDATRWFSNISNRQVNLQLFTQGIGEFHNVIFETDPFIMTGGLVSPNNPGGVSGDRYFMIQVSTMAPNWTSTTKLIRLLNCKTDSLLTNNSFEVLDEQEIESQFPGLLDEFNAQKNEYAAIYPNPSSGKNQVAVEFASQFGQLQEVLCIDQMGNQVYLEFTNLEIFDELTRYQLQVANTPKGVHTIVLVFDNGMTKTLRLIH